jgi:small GTP-binding protein
MFESNNKDKEKKLNDNDEFSKRNSISEVSLPYHYIFKIILIGDSGIGKTSIINRYIHNSFNDKYICTIGVDFMMKTMNIEETQIKLQVWDTAGMERYKQLTTSYYKGSHSAIIVFDLTNKSSFDNVEYWLNLFYENSNPIFQKYVMLIGNKADMVDSIKVTPDMIEAFIKDRNIQYAECSARTGENISSVFESLGRKLFENFKFSYNEKIKSMELRKSSKTTEGNFQSLADKSKEKKSCC